MSTQNPIELITIQKNYPYSNSETDVLTNWQTYATSYAELQIGTGKEYYGAKRINTEISGLIKTLQYIKGVTDDMQVVCSRGTFGIVAVIDQREDNRLEIHLKKVS